MMTERKRNLMVGLVVLMGLILMAWMILQFGGVAINLFTSKTMITVLTDRADGVGDGSAVLFRGVQVGQVRNVRMTDDMERVVLTIQLNSGARVPANVTADIRPLGLIGGSSSVFLEIQGPQPEGRLLAGAEIRGQVGTLNLLPKEFTQLADDLRKTSQSFRESGVIDHLDKAVVNISDQATRAGDVLQSVQKIVGDPKIKDNLAQSLENINQATATAKTIASNLEKFSGTMDRTGQKLDTLTGEATETVRDARAAIKSASGNVDQVTRQMADRLTQVSMLLDNLNSVTRKVDMGKGTAGMMVNDPKLYEALVDSAKQLNGTLTDMKRLVEQWEQEGITFRLK